MRILCLKNEAGEGLGLIQNWATAKGHDVINHACYETDNYPNLKTVDLIVIAGGAMGVDDEGKHPWLAKEKLYIQAAIKANKPMLGICLGAQLIAHILGAKVYPNRYKEIGWMPVKKINSKNETDFNPFEGLPNDFEVMHWHNDTFSLPEGAVHLAKTDACDNQAFIYQQHVIGIQFHIELTMANLKLLCHEYPPVTDKYVQSAFDICNSEEKLISLESTMAKIMDNIANQLCPA